MSRRRGLAILLALALAFAWLGSRAPAPSGGGGRIDPLLGSLDLMDAAKGQRALASVRARLADAPGSPRAGNPRGTIPVAIFFDYRCTFCRELPPRLQQLAVENGDVRLVFKEWPIFGGISEVAARTALAADRQGAYWPMHEALMEARPLTESGMLAIADGLGLDRERLLRDRDDPAIAAELAATAELASTLHLQGTPVLIVGDRVIRGLPREGELEAAVAAAAGSS